MAHPRGQLILNPVRARRGFSLGNVHVMAGVPAVFQSANLPPTLPAGAPMLMTNFRIEGGLRAGSPARWSGSRVRASAGLGRQLSVQRARHLRRRHRPAQPRSRRPAAAMEDLRRMADALLAEP